MSAKGKLWIPLWISRRFLFSQFADPFLTFVSWVSIVGVGLGVASLVVVTAVMNGFEGELKRVVSGVNGEVLFYSRGETIDHPEEVENKIRSILPELKAITPSFVAEVMVVGPSGPAGAILEGIDPETNAKVTLISKQIARGHMPNSKEEVVIGKALAERIGIDLGDEVTLLLPRIESSSGEYSSKSIKVRVSGIVNLGWYDYDSKFLYSQLPEVQRWMEKPGSVTTYKLTLPSSYDPRIASQKLTENFGFPFRARDWTQLNRNLLYAIQLEKAVISIILTAIIIVAAFNVVSTLMMLLQDKVREFSILKAMGAMPRMLFQLVSTLGLTIGGIGALLGVGVGWILVFILSKTHWIELPPEVYYIGFLPVQLRWNEVLVISLIATGISWVAAFYPAIKSANLSPMDGIRNEG